MSAKYARGLLTVILILRARECFSDSRQPPTHTLASLQIERHHSAGAQNAAGWDSDGRGLQPVLDMLDATLLSNCPNLLLCKKGIAHYPTQGKVFGKTK